MGVRSSGFINRRASVRRKPKGVQIKCRQGTLGTGPDIALALRNLSETGARLLVTAPLTLGEDVEIELAGAAEPKPFRLRATVVRFLVVPGDVFLIAVRFQSRLSYGDFQRLT